MASPLAYEEKKKMLFDCLLTAEKSIVSTTLEQKESYTSRMAHRNQSKVVVRRFQGKESIFKRPAAPISKCLKPRRAPDYQVNPHKWKKYSLSDADISERTNTSAAFAFLQEIEKRKDLNSGSSDDDEMEGKITFNRKETSKIPKYQRSVQLRNAIESSEAGEDDVGTKPILKGSKVLMPEYVIGQKSNDRKRKATSSKKCEKTATECRNALKLQHLLDEEDEDAD